MKKILVWVKFFLLAVVVNVNAQTNVSKIAVAPKPILPLVNYVLQTGSAANMETYLLDPLRLGNQDIAVAQKGFRSRENDMNHLIAISTKNNSDVFIFLFNKSGVGVCWLTSPNGELRRAIKFNRPTHTAEVVPNEKVADSFELEKKYLTARIAAASKTVH